MFLSTLVTLIIVPICYALFERLGATLARMAETGDPDPSRARSAAE